MYALAQSRVGCCSVLSCPLEATINPVRHIHQSVILFYTISVGLRLSSSHSGYRLQPSMSLGLRHIRLPSVSINRSFPLLESHLYRMCRNIVQLSPSFLSYPFRLTQHSLPTIIFLGIRFVSILFNSTIFVRFGT